MSCALTVSPPLMLLSFLQHGQPFGTWTLLNSCLSHPTKCPATSLRKWYSGPKRGKCGSTQSTMRMVSNGSTPEKCKDNEQNELWQRDHTDGVPLLYIRPRGGSQCLVPWAYLLRETLGGGLPPSRTSASLHGACGGRSVQKPISDSPAEEGQYFLVQRLFPAKRGCPQGGWGLVDSST